VSNRPTRKPSHSAKVQATTRAAQAQAQRSRVAWIIGGVVGVVVLVAVLAVVLTRSSNAPETQVASAGTVVSGNASYGSPRTTGTPLPPMPSGAADPAIGQAIPTVKGDNMSEQPLDITNDGKPKVIMFLAHWCPHCQAEVPRIQDWIAANGLPSDVELVAVATGTSDQKPNFPPTKWLQKEGWTVPTLVDDEQGTIADAYGLSSFPFFVVVGADGKVITRTSGELSTADWEALVAQARAGGASGSTISGGPASPGGSAVPAARG
jgi:thiol-disulfide isomerase/thioredoxin